MLYIFEGCDCTGKTTAIEKLKAITNIDIHVHGTAKWNNFSDFEQVKYYGELIEMANKGLNILLERSWLSAKIYSRALGKKSITNETFDFLQQLSGIGTDNGEGNIFRPLDNKFVEVIFRRNWETLRKTYEGRKEQEYVKEESILINIFDKYEKYISEAMAKDSKNLMYLHGVQDDFGFFIRRGDQAHSFWSMADLKSELIEGIQI